MDGDPTNGWPALPEAVVPVPVAGVCHPAQWAPDLGVVDEVVGCDRYHQTETVYVGRFTGADAARPAPPGPHTPARAAAYRQCTAAMDAYLGGDWHTSLVWVGLAVPGQTLWTGGARWFRCDATQYVDIFLADAVTSGTVKDGMRGTRPLAITCVTATVEQSTGRVETALPTRCDKPHTAELAGVYTGPDIPYPTDEATRHGIARAGCDHLVARYLGFSDGVNRNPKLFSWDEGFEDVRWYWGDRTELCYVWPALDRKLVGSVKGIGAGTPRYA